MFDAINYGLGVKNKGMEPSNTQAEYFFFQEKIFVFDILEGKSK